MSAGNLLLKVQTVITTMEMLLIHSIVGKLSTNINDQEILHVQPTYMDCSGKM